MNCEAYIAYYRGGSVSLYPNNIDCEFLDRILVAVSDTKSESHDSLAILRKGDVVYYAFIAPFVGAGGDRVCIMVSLNGILITDIPALSAFMRQTLRSLSDKYNIAHYDAGFGGYLSRSRNDVNLATSISEAQAELRGRFSERFSNSGAQLGPTDYGHSPKIDFRTLPNDTPEANTGASIAKSIESGNTLIVAVETTEEKEIAKLRSKIERYKEENAKYKIEILRLRTENNKLRNENIKHVKPNEKKAVRAGDDKSQLSSAGMNILYVIGVMLIITAIIGIFLS